MIHEAIVEIGDRTGSSVPALQKFMKQKYEYLQRIEKKKFSTSFYNALKLGLKEERFVKIRNSYKMNREWVNKQKAAQKAKEVKKKNAEKKRKKEVEKARIEREKKKKEEKEKKEKLEKQEKAQKALLAAALAKKEDIVNDENKVCI
jgi:histone H1/5